MSSLGEFLKRARRESDKSLGQIALSSGIDKGYLSKVENGTRDPKPDTLRKIAEAYRVDYDVLVRLCAHIPVPVSGGIRRIPVYGRIPAGIPIEAIEDITDYEEELERKLQPDKEYIALTVSGDSMNPVYMSGDIIIVRLQEHADTGDDAVVFVNNDDATLKRISISEKGLTLKPLNNEYEPMFFTPAEVEKLPVRILGVVVQLRRNIRG